MLDHRNDMFITTGTLIAILMSKLDIYFVDGIIGILISTWIIYTGIRIFIESFNVLMDEAIDNKSKELIIKEVLQEKQIKKIEQIYTIPIGYKYVIVLIVNMDGNLTTKESHEIIDNVEKQLEKKFKLIERVLIHVNPL